MDYLIDEFNYRMWQIQTIPQGDKYKEIAINKAIEIYDELRKNNIILCKVNTQYYTLQSIQMHLDIYKSNIQSLLVKLNECDKLLVCLYSEDTMDAAMMRMDLNKVKKKIIQWFIDNMIELDYDKVYKCRNLENDIFLHKIYIIDNKRFLHSIGR